MSLSAAVCRASRRQLTRSASTCVASPPVQAPTPIDYDGPVSTQVLFLHHGVAENSDEALRLIAESARRYYRLIPTPIIRGLTRAYHNAHGGATLRRLFDHADSAASGRTVHRRLCGRLSAALDALLPEFGPFAVDFAYADVGEPAVGEAVARVHRRSPSRVVAVPFYAHYWCFQSGHVINRLYEELCAQSQQVAAGEPHVRRALLRGVTGERVGAGPTEWTLVDRMSHNPMVAEVHAQRIAAVIACLPEDTRRRIGILFCAPFRRGYDSASYMREVSATALRVCQLLSNKYAHRVAWTSDWDRHRVYRGGESVLPAAARLTRSGASNLVLAPVDSLLADANTEAAGGTAPLSRTVLRWLGAEFVRVVRPTADGGDALLHGLAEVVRNHLLADRRPTGQFANRCSLCTSPTCTHSRFMFAP